MRSNISAASGSVFPRTLIRKSTPNDRRYRATHQHHFPFDIFRLSCSRVV